jgi:hypothetical protein
VQIAIVGLAGSGKTTVFNTLTRGHAETGGYGALTLNVGVVKVPDARLDRLAEIFRPKKVVQADVTYVDLPAPPPSSEGHVGTEELPAEHLARLRESDALLHVVRAFEAFHLAPRSSAVYNLGGGRASNCSVLEAIAMCETVAGRHLESRLDDTARVGDHCWWISDLREFQSHYPEWSLQYDIELILRDIYDSNVEPWQSLALQQ